MPLASQLTPDRNAVTLFVGDSGCGKSCATAFYPKPIKWFDLTKRSAGILGHPLVAQKPAWLDQIDIARIDVSKGFTALDTELEMLTIKNQYKTVVVEDFTAASDIFQEEAFRFTGALKDKEGKAISWHKQLGRISLPGLDEFAYEDAAFKSLMTAVAKLNCNVICHVHWTDRYEGNKVVGKKISLRPATVPKVMKWYNEVYYFDKEYKKEVQNNKEVHTTKYKVVFRNEIARTLYTNLPDEVEWTGQDFYQLLQNSIGVAQ